MYGIRRFLARNGGKLLLRKFTVSGLLFGRKSAGADVLHTSLVLDSLARVGCFTI